MALPPYLASGYCQRGPEFGGDTHPIKSGQTMRWHFVFLIPDGANGFRLALRSSAGDLQNVGHINLSCC
jgi:hypothetical protein